MGVMSRSMKSKFAILLMLFIAPAFATLLVPSISFVIHEENDKFLIHVTNITGKPKTFTRIELSVIKNNSIQDFRRNILCKCGTDCKEASKVIKPNTTLTFVWDGNKQSCERAELGDYRLQLVDKCDVKGCLGTYWPSIGNYVNVKK